MGALARPATSFGTLARIAIWTCLGTAVVDLVIAGIPVLPARILASAPAVVVGLLIVGAVAAVPRAGAPGWVAALAGSAAGHLVFLAVAHSLADVMQGNTAVMPRAEFAGFVFASLVGAFGVLAASYWGAATILRRRDSRSAQHDAPHPPRVATEGAGRWLRGPIPTVLWSTALALIFAGGVGSWAAGSSFVLEETETAVHRLTITGTTIAVDAAIVKAGEVTWLATVSGRLPHDLMLVNVAGREISNVGTPPEGSTDFLLARMTMTPGEWYFTVGLEYAGAGEDLTTPGTDPGSAAGLPVGRLIVRFTVTP